MTIATELARIADDLDRHEREKRKLYERRMVLWQRGKENGMRASELARFSRLEAVTVRQLMKRHDR